MEIPQYHADIHDRFVKRLKADEAAGFIEPWMTSWYWKELFPQYGDSQGYKGPSELLGWITSQSNVRTYHNPADLEFLKARAIVQEIEERRIIDHPVFAGDPRVAKINRSNHALYSAQDFYFQTLKQDPTSPIRTVVDFGSGCGRMALQWLKLRNAAFISVDGIPQTYCIQHLFYCLSGAPLVDYMVEPDFKVGDAPGTIYHTPSWRLELLPNSSADLISTVQVLGELRPEMFEHVVDHFYRILRPGGIFYVRDHGLRHNPNNVKIPERITARGFRLEYEPGYVDMQDIHGIPKVWRKPNA